MEESSKLGLALSEETITETCLYNIAREHQSGEIAVIPATKPQEAKHGADWEWWFTRGGRGVGYRVQAKRLFPTSRYESLSAKPGGSAQLKKLVSNAKADGLDPLYCFYNFDSPSSGFHGYPNNCGHTYRGPSFWGCTIALPDDVEKSASNGINDLRDIMVPWHSLVCRRPKSDLPTSVLRNVGKLAEAKNLRGVRRAEVDVAVEQRQLPGYVHRLIDFGRSRREAAAEGNQYMDHEYWIGETYESDVAGIAVFDDRR